MKKNAIGNTSKNKFFVYWILCTCTWEIHKKILTIRCACIVIPVKFDSAFCYVCILFTLAFVTKCLHSLYRKQPQAIIFMEDTSGVSRLQNKSENILHASSVNSKCAKTKLCVCIGKRLISNLCINAVNAACHVLRGK